MHACQGHNLQDCSPTTTLALTWAAHLAQHTAITYTKNYRRVLLNLSTAHCCAYEQVCSQTYYVEIVFQCCSNSTSPMYTEELVARWAT
jgi:hypothetical protein